MQSCLHSIRRSGSAGSRGSLAKYGKQGKEREGRGRIWKVTRRVRGKVAIGVGEGVAFNPLHFFIAEEDRRAEGIVKVTQCRVAGGAQRRALTSSEHSVD